MSGDDRILSRFERFFILPRFKNLLHIFVCFSTFLRLCFKLLQATVPHGGSVAEWLACWTEA